MYDGANIIVVSGNEDIMSVEWMHNDVQLYTTNPTTVEASRLNLISRLSQSCSFDCLFSISIYTQQHLFCLICAIRTETSFMGFVVVFPDGEFSLLLFFFFFLLCSIVSKKQASHLNAIAPIIESFL